LDGFSTMSLTPKDWHERFTQQARWTKDLREHLYALIGLRENQRVLDVGCGTGILEFELTQEFSTKSFGVDIDYANLSLAAVHSAGARLAQGDAHALPYPDGCFDITLCHFVLLWTSDPGRVVQEMKRVTRSGGAVLALAEPDYGGRIDYPPELEVLGQWQLDSLHRQGADPLVGRKLAGFFNAAGLEPVETGVLGGQWSGAPSWDERRSEWATIQADLGISSELWKAAGASIPELRRLEEAAWSRGERVLFVPTFYAWGRVS
jgi:SAM-dependent methyltransferase